MGRKKPHRIVVQDRHASDGNDAAESTTWARELKDADEAMGNGLAYIWSRTFWAFGMPFFRAAISEGRNLAPEHVPKCPSSDNPRCWAERMHFAERATAIRYPVPFL